MIIYNWSKKWGVSADAVRDLMTMCNALNDIPISSHTPKSEAAVQQLVRLQAAQQGALLWRNNVGVMTDSRGVPVRYGLANDTKALNEKIKSSDLIGLRPVRITPAHVGTVIGQFWAREVKAEGWAYTGTAHEEAQLQFITLVNSHGGDAKFTTGEL